jgi:outer membrane murein-binding lipoprotein Lpp
MSDTPRTQAAIDIAVSQPNEVMRVVLLISCSSTLERELNAANALKADLAKTAKELATTVEALTKERDQARAEAAEWLRRGLKGILQ